MPLTVHLDDELDAPGTRAELASLPHWLRAGGSTAAVRAVSGNRPNWTERVHAALTRETRAILLSDVTPVDPASVRELAATAEAAGVPVVVASPWALNPATLDAAEQLRAAAPSSALVEAFTAHDVAPAKALLAQLALLRTTVGDVTSLRLTRNDQHGHLGSARLADVPVHLSGVRSTAGPDTRLILRGRGEQWRVHFGDPALARPATVIRIDENGEHLLPTVYETAHRAAWRHTHAATEGVTPPYTLHQLADDLSLLPAGALPR
ncbi:hypothetical protein MOQ72_40220 [Saccharopolyspora sp. K220]|uniref:hypothetical protein n=1 Tax=Saccharopolyspora soli TaxID=2926618 RepID=UPI001F580BAB|nr:hypothetical protein [Saccharopolyspora soli]MCI2423650.1 hypothetical protein [Saccharopolyspora soli]